MPGFDVEKYRAEFPILAQKVHDRPLVYLDNAATTHKPRAVIQALQQFYAQENANIHRGMHALSTRATTALEATRAALQQWMGAASTDEVIFTSGTTESLNLLAWSYGEMVLQAGDEVLVSLLEHHSNLLPWQLLCQRKKAHLKVLPTTDAGRLDLQSLDDLLTPRTKILALTHLSNVIGTINPMAYLIERAHAVGAVVVVDGAQAVSHFPIDVVALDCDFLAFSAHKMYGPTGVGCLYGKKKWLQKMLPYQTGGGMVGSLDLHGACCYQDPPYKFEAGTPPLAAIVAWMEAIRFLSSISHQALMAYESQLYAYAWHRLAALDGIQLIGDGPENRMGSIAFQVEKMHPLDVGLLLDAQGIALRTGHCCCQPLLHRLGFEGIVRISLALYNTKEEVDRLLEALKQMISASGTAPS